LSQLRDALADRYRLERELGRGGMATVHLAHDLKHRRDVALKVLDREAGETVGSNRFAREIHLAAGLVHPHIVPVFDSGADAGRLWYAMPYLRGESLRARIAREGRLSVSDALRITREVAEALDYAHRQGVIHRDVKPENILLAEGQALLADFGIARAAQGTGGDTHTATGITIGTPAYMSPEQAGGEGELDGRSDIYSLGCVLYEMLAGTPPYPGRSLAAAIANRLEGRPAPIEQLRPEVAIPVRQVLNRALAFEPRDRFETAAHFAQALEAVSTQPGEPAAWTPPIPASEEREPPGPSPSGLTVAGFLGRRPRRRRAILLATAVLTLTAGAVLWRGRGGAARQGEYASVAVLPFVDLSPDRSSAYLGDGMAETLINALAKVEGLNVAARTSAFSFRDAAEDVRRIGRELGVATVLEGSVQRAGDRLRVTAQLVKTSDGLHLWSENFDRDARDIFAVQDEVAGAVVAALKGRLVPHPAPILGQPSTAPTGETASPAAYDAYLLGRFHWNKRTASDLVRATEYYAQAIRADSNYARAWSGLADAYVLFIPAEYGVPRIDRDSILSLAEQAARRAIALAPDFGEAYTSLGLILDYRRKWEEGHQAFLRGIQLSPDYATGHQWYSYDLMMRNRWEEAIREMERARQLDPLAPIILVSLGFAYDGADRPGEAEAQFARARAIAPGHLLTTSFGFIHEVLSGDFAQAAADYHGFLLVTGGDSSRAATMERRIRDPAQRADALEEASGSWINFEVAIHRAVEGEGAMAAYLETLVDDPRRQQLFPPSFHSILGPRLRADPRIRAVLGRMGYPVGPQGSGGAPSASGGE